MKLLDLDALMPSPLPSPGNAATQAVSTIPANPGPNPIPKALTGYPESNNGAACGDAIPVIPIIPVKNAGRGPKVARAYPISPAAVALVLAWSKRTRKDRETCSDALQSLAEIPPGEQLARWSQACQNVGVLPWRVWHLESPGNGYECTGCRFFDSFVDSVQGSRRRFHWRCSLGYPVFELWRWAGLMLIAPPDCSRFEPYTIPDRITDRSG